MEARKEVGIRRNVSWEGSEFCTRTKGRSDSMAPSPTHDRLPDWRRGQQRQPVLKSPGQEDMRRSSHNSSTARAHGPLGTSNHPTVPRTPGPPPSAVNHLFTWSLLPIILLLLIVQPDQILCKIINCKCEKRADDSSAAY